MANSFDINKFKEFLESSLTIKPIHKSSFISKIFLFVQKNQYCPFECIPNYNEKDRNQINSYLISNGYFEAVTLLVSDVCRKSISKNPKLSFEDIKEFSITDDKDLRTELKEKISEIDPFTKNNLRQSRRSVISVIQYETLGERENSNMKNMENMVRNFEEKVIEDKRKIFEDPFIFPELEPFEKKAIECKLAGHKSLEKQKDRVDFAAKIDDILQNQTKEIRDLIQAIDFTKKLEESLKEMFEEKIFEKNENLMNNFELKSIEIYVNEFRNILKFIFTQRTSSLAQENIKSFQHWEKKFKEAFENSLTQILEKNVDFWIEMSEKYEKVKDQEKKESIDFQIYLENQVKFSKKKLPLENLGKTFNSIIQEKLRLNDLNFHDFLKQNKSDSNLYDEFSKIFCRKFRKSLEIETLDKLDILNNCLDQFLKTKGKILKVKEKFQSEYEIQEKTIQDLKGILKVCLKDLEILKNEGINPNEWEQLFWQETENEFKIKEEKLETFRKNFDNWFEKVKEKKSVCLE